jgi:hypothetical protein
MYEENLTSLPDGDFSRVFAELLAAIECTCKPNPPERITPGNVLQWTKMCGRLESRWKIVCGRMCWWETTYFPPIQGGCDEPF